MLLSEKILDILGKQDISYSAESLAKELEVSCSAVQEGMDALRAQGYIIEAAGSGSYRLAESNRKLCASQLRHFCGNSVTFFECTDSTNTQAKRLAQEGAEEGTLVVAERQTAGRGRLGRKFFSPESGLYFSLILRPEFKGQALLYITSAAAVAAAEAIEAAVGKPCLIKWVNDIYCNNLKVCGILTEGSVNAELGKLDYSVLGVGINLSAPHGGFPGEIKNIAGSLLEKDAATSRMKAALIEKFKERFFMYYEELERKSFLPEYRRRSFLCGRQVEYGTDGKTHSATVIGIDDNARLILSEGSKIIYLNAGEVQLRF